MARTSTQTSPLAASSTELSDAEALDFSARVVVALLMAYNVQLSDIALSEDKTFGVPQVSLTYSKRAGQRYSIDEWGSAE
jgi:hypothetical protein